MIMGSYTIGKHLRKHLEFWCLWVGSARLNIWLAEYLNYWFPTRLNWKAKIWINCKKDTSYLTQKNTHHVGYYGCISS